MSKCMLTMYKIFPDGGKAGKFYLEFVSPLMRISSPHFYSRFNPRTPFFSDVPYIC